MNKNYKKYLAFLLYLFMVSIPILYWVNSSWGISVLFRKQVFLNLLASDFSFGLTIMSAIGATTIGIAAILMKQTHQVQTERDIYDDGYASVPKNASLNFISTTEILNPQSSADFDSSSTNFDLPQLSDSNTSIHTERHRMTNLHTPNFAMPKAPPPAIDVASMKGIQIKSSQINTNPSPVSIPTSVVDSSKNTHPVPQPVDTIIQDMQVEKDPIISSTASEIKTSIPDGSKYFDNILKEKGYKTFNVKSIDCFDLKFFAVSNKNILFGYYVPYNGDIIANESIPENSDIKNPHWFSQIQRFVSPIYAVKEIRKNIDDLMMEVLPKNHDITIESYCIVNDNAKILNFNDMKDMWSEESINVVMQSKQFETIPPFTDVIEDNSTNEIMPSFLEFSETMAKYYIQKARISTLKKHT